MRNIDPNALTVEDLLALGADAMEAACGGCGKTWRAPISFLPAGTTARTLAALMICPSCGGRDIDAHPAWSDQPPQLN